MLEKLLAAYETSSLGSSAHTRKLVHKGVRRIARPAQQETPDWRQREPSKNAHAMNA
jgi:hypothetical protein